MEVIETLWFTNLDGCIGIVVVEEDVTGDRKAYIGPASGTDEKANTESILAWGNKFSLDTAQRIEQLLTKGSQKDILKQVADWGLFIVRLNNGDWMASKATHIYHLEITQDHYADPSVSISPDLGEAVAQAVEKLRSNHDL